MVEDEVRHLDVDGSRFSFRVKLTGQAMAVPLDWNPPKNDTADPWILIISSEEFECGEEMHVYTALSDLTDEDLEAAARRCMQKHLQ